MTIEKITQDNNPHLHLQLNMAMNAISKSLIDLGVDNSVAITALITVAAETAYRCRATEEQVVEHMRMAFLNSRDTAKDN